MTFTIDLPTDAVRQLEDEATRTGKPVDTLIAEAVIEHLRLDPQIMFDRIASRVPAPGFVADLSRESIYAE